MDRERSRSGIGAFLASIRILFDNPVSRLVLRSASANVKCVLNNRVVEKSIVYHALSMFAGEQVNCPITARFAATLVNSIIRVGVKMLRGREEDLVEALKDPALRRGVALVMKGLGLYGVTVPQKIPAPFLIVWNFTNMCNLRCMHCYQRADKPLPSELSLKEKLMIVEQLDKAGIAAIALSGGEPTIHPDFYRVVSEISARGMYVAVATNGWVFADIKNLIKAKKAGLRYVEVSIDSADPKKHDWFRGVTGSWERAVNALRNAVKLGINNAIAVTLTKANIDEIEDILDLAEEIGVRRVVFFNFVPVGRGRNYIWLDLSPTEREKVLRTLFREMKKRRGLQIISTAPYYGRVSMQLSGGEDVAPTHFYVGGDPIIRAIAEFIGGCGAGRIYAAIQPNGDVTPCVFMPITVGNLRKKPFWNIWLNSSLFNLLRNRDRLKGFCGKCPYRNICGGCRARAYAYYKDPIAPDPGCIFNSKYWKELQNQQKVRITIPK